MLFMSEKLRSLEEAFPVSPLTLLAGATRRGRYALVGRQRGGWQPGHVERQRGEIIRGVVHRPGR